MMCVSGLAQWLARLAHNQKATGSSPVSATAVSDQALKGPGDVPGGKPESHPASLTSESGRLARHCVWGAAMGGSIPPSPTTPGS